MSKRCARDGCGKTVYPLEELKCLDKIWHKICFKCTVCGMTLNMKNYKGYNKMPYCEPHYPKTVASVVSDTPEMRRIAGNTKLQSQVQYHAEYEKMKGTKIQIADDPEISRHMKNTQAQSQVAYTGELMKKHEQDQQRSQTVQANESGVQVNGMTSPTPSNGHPPAVADTPYSSRLAQQGGTLIYSSEQGGTVNQQPRNVGRIDDYDPLNGMWGTVGGASADRRINSYSHQSALSQHSTISPSVSTTVVQNPLNGQKYNDVNEEVARTSGAISPATSLSPGRTSNGSSVANSVDAGRGTGAASSAAGFAVKAIYDYTAADKDEVTFLEGDIIVNCQKVDEGWMTGTVQRTLQWGMLPANYVEPHKLPTGFGRLK